MAGNRPEPDQAGAELYNINDGIFGRSGGPYGDEVDLRTAEYQSAIREGRDPDYSKVGSAPAVQLVTGPQLAASYNPALIAGDDRRIVTTQVPDIKAPVYGETGEGQSELPDKEAQK